MEKALFAFATKSELQGVFSNVESASTFVSDKLISMPQYNAFAAVLGVGSIEFSANLVCILAMLKKEGISVSSVILLGICGAFPERNLSVGEVVRISSETVGDMGYQEADGTFTPWINTCRYESADIEKAVGAIPAELASRILKLRTVAGLSVNCCTGTADTASRRVQMFNCDVESMEGASLFSVCNALQIPAIEIRAVSNIASTRNKSQWKMAEALQKLAKIFSV